MLGSQDQISKEYLCHQKQTGKGVLLEQEDLIDKDKLSKLLGRSGFDVAMQQYCLENPYVLYTSLLYVKKYMNGVGLLERVCSCKTNLLSQKQSLDSIVDVISSSFDWVDPKIIKWFGGSEYAIANITGTIYRSTSNMSHKQTISYSQNCGFFRTYSLGEALLLVNESVKSGFLDWPNKYLIVYITDRYEDKPCRVLGYVYDNGSVEVYVNQMDPGDVRTPGVCYML